MYNLIQQCVSRVVIKTPTRSLVNSLGNDLLYTHIGSIGHYTDFALGS